MPDWQFDIGHESNDDQVTEEKIQVMKASIMPDDLLVVSFAAGVSEKNVRLHLLTGKTLPKKTQFFMGSIYRYSGHILVYLLHTLSS
jgi:hypothetical protein